MATIRRLDAGLASKDTAEFTFRLMNEKNFLPDILKDYERMLGKYQSVMSECCQPWGFCNSKNQLGGVMFVSDVVPGHESALYIWLWDKSCYTATTHRFMMDYIEHCVMSNQLGNSAQAVELYQRVIALPPSEGEGAVPPQQLDTMKATAAGHLQRLGVQQLPADKPPAEIPPPAPPPTDQGQEAPAE